MPYIEILTYSEAIYTLLNIFIYLFELQFSCSIICSLIHSDKGKP